MSPRLSSHEGGGAWPGGVGGCSPPGPIGAQGSLFGDGSYSGNVIQGGSALQVQFSYEYKVHPTATGPTTGDMTITADSVYPIAQYAAWHALDGVIGSDSATGGTWANYNAIPGWWQMAFAAKRRVTRYTMAGDSESFTSRNPNTWTLQASNTGAFAGEQVILDTQAGITFSPSQVRSFTIENPGDYLYYRLAITAINGSTFISISELAFYGTISNAIVITGAATVSPDPETGAAVLMAPNLVIDGGSLTTSTNCKGLVGFIKGQFVMMNGATMHMNSKGKAGNFGDLTVYDLTPSALKRKLNRAKLGKYLVKGEGALGGASVSVGASTVATGATGGAAQAGSMQSGGGASGGGFGSSTVTTGAGGKGGPCCGGGGGSAAHSASAVVGNDAAPYGPGANAPATATGACGGGAGDPNGTGYNGGGVGLGPGGGLILLVAAQISISPGCAITAHGSTVNTGGMDYSAPGGSSGGGIVGLISAPGGYTNTGTVAANGGAACPATANSRGVGGPGGAGSVNIFQDAT